MKMEKRLFELIDRLNTYSSLEESEYAELIVNFTPEAAQYAAFLAVQKRKKHYGNTVFIRGLIEISNICKNDCYYCGIRRSNTSCERFRLTKEQIISCCRVGYPLGFRTFVLQGGEDGYFTDEAVTDIVRSIKSEFPDAAVTLSLGERSRESYGLLFEAGADRYLLRHETADREHYSQLHPENMRFDERMRCLYDLREIGFQVGCGFMVGSPYQSAECIAKDLKFIEKFKPDMCGIGPFVPHHATPFADFKTGRLDLTLFLLSLIRLSCEKVLLPATTALGTIHPEGRERGILSGANVVMPNLSPEDSLKKYELYDNKRVTGEESAANLAMLKEKIAAIGYEIAVDRGDIRK